MAKENKNKANILIKLAKNNPNLVDEKTKMRIEAYEDVKKRVREEVTNLVEEQVMNFVGIMVLALHDELGFGKKRLEKFVNRIMEQGMMMSEGFLTRDDIFETVKQETGFDFDSLVQAKIDEIISKKGKGND